MFRDNRFSHNSHIAWMCHPPHALSFFQNHFQRLPHTSTDQAWLHPSCLDLWWCGMLSTRHYNHGTCWSGFQTAEGLPMDDPRTCKRTCPLRLPSSYSSNYAPIFFIGSHLHIRLHAVDRLLPVVVRPVGRDNWVLLLWITYLSLGCTDTSICPSRAHSWPNDLLLFSLLLSIFLRLTA